MAIIHPATDTPKHWAKYLEYLEKKYQDDLLEWTNQCFKEMKEYQERSWFQKIMLTEDDLRMHHEWVKPDAWDKKYQPTLVDYYNWDVEKPDFHKF